MPKSKPLLRILYLLLKMSFHSLNRKKNIMILCLMKVRPRRVARESINQAMNAEETPEQPTKSKTKVTSHDIISMLEVQMINRSCS